jgi:hypothetical protein
VAVAQPVEYVCGLKAKEFVFANTGVNASTAVRECSTVRRPVVELGTRNRCADEEQPQMASVDDLMA